MSENSWSFQLVPKIVCFAPFKASLLVKLWTQAKTAIEIRYNQAHFSSVYDNKAHLLTLHHLLGAHLKCKISWQSSQSLSRMVDELPTLKSPPLSCEAKTRLFRELLRNILKRRSRKQPVLVALQVGRCTLINPSWAKHSYSKCTFRTLLPQSYDIPA